MALQGRKHRERGGALLIAVVVTVPLMGFAGAMLYLNVHYSDEIVSDTQRSRSINAAEIGVALAVEELVAGEDGELTGSVAGGTFTVTSLNKGDNEFEVLSAAVEDGEERIIEAGVGLIPVESLTFEPGGAVVANSVVEVIGSNEIDGRDYNEFGTAIVGLGVWGIQTTRSVDRRGNGKIGGNGSPPAKNESQTQQGYSWADGIDDDEDGSTDEEASDGVDNDSDGEIDEDVNNFPENPDAVLGLAPGTLKAAAEGYGTYFTSGADLDQYAADNGGTLPGGKIYYLEVNLYGPVNWDMDLTGDPAVLIIRNASGSSEVKNWHADFKGLLIADRFDKFNGNCIIVGAVVTLDDDDDYPKFANGNSTVRYSSAVLGMLPSTVVEPKVQFLTWREVY